MFVLFLSVTFVLVTQLSRILYKRLSYRFLLYNRKMDASCAFVADTVTMTEVIHNKSVLPIPWVRIETMAGEGLQFKQLENMNINGAYHHSVFSLMPFTKVTRRHVIRLVKRGFYDMPGCSFSVGDAFGAMPKVFERKCSASILIYPRILEKAPAALLLNSLEGSETVKRVILSDPYAVSGVKEYDYLTPRNAINWKATARAGRLLEYRHEFTSDPRCVVVLNVDTESERSGVEAAGKEAAALEYAVSAAATLACLCAKAGCGLGICANAGLRADIPGAEDGDEPVFLPAQTGRTQGKLVLRALALLKLKSAGPISAVIEQNAAELSHIDIIFFTLYMDREIESCAEFLRRCGSTVEFLPLFADGGAGEAIG